MTRPFRTFGGSLSHATKRQRPESTGPPGLASLERVRGPPSHLQSN